MYSIRRMTTVMHFPIVLLLHRAWPQIALLNVLGKFGNSLGIQDRFGLFYLNILQYLPTCTCCTFRSERKHKARIARKVFFMRGNNSWLSPSTMLSTALRKKRETQRIVKLNPSNWMHTALSTRTKKFDKSRYKLPHEIMCWVQYAQENILEKYVAYIFAP